MKKTKPGRRSSKDKKWQEVKNLVARRDNMQCRLCKILSISEMAELKRQAPSHILKVVDPAHVIPVGVNASMCYMPENIVTLNRYSHDMLDYNKHPITGETLTKHEVMDWWIRIVGEELFKQLLALSKNRKRL